MFITIILNIVLNFVTKYDSGSLTTSIKLLSNIIII